MNEKKSSTRKVGLSSKLNESLSRIVESMPTRIIKSSSYLASMGILVQKEHYSPGQRQESVIDSHVISMLTGEPSMFEYELPRGRFVMRQKLPDTITVHPVGHFPPVRLHAPAEFINIAIDKNFVEKELAELDQSPAPFTEFASGIEDKAAIQIIKLLEEELEAEMPIGGLYIESLAHALVLRYVRLNGQEPTPQRGSTSALPSLSLNRVKEKMRAGLHGNLSLSDLARESGYSRSHFIRMFRVATGMTPHHFVMQLRVNQAKGLLRQKNLRLVDIAFLSGFSSHAHMTFVFRKLLGETPAELRRRLGITAADESDQTAGPNNYEFESVLG